MELLASKLDEVSHLIRWDVAFVNLAAGLVVSCQGLICPYRVADLMARDGWIGPRAQS